MEHVAPELPVRERKRPADDRPRHVPSSSPAPGDRVLDPVEPGRVRPSSARRAEAAGGTRIRRAVSPAGLGPSTTATAGRIRPRPVGATVHPVTGRVQRRLDHAATRSAPDIDLAASIPRGHPSGFTPPTVNDRVMPVPNGTAAAATAALRGPEVVVEPDPEGRGHRARITAVPTNSVGAEVHFPAPPTWTDPAADPVRIAAVAIGGEAPTMRFDGSATLAVLDAVATTRFRARGEIGDAGFRQQILLHEQHHADDHWTAAQTVLGAWDTALTSAHAEGRTFAVDSPAGATDVVAAAAGGTPRELGVRLDAEWSRLDQVFHADPAGAASDLSHYFVEHDGSGVDAWYAYPH